mmetsp:Transcript_3432/g.5181  ORF Transcript_3432/g.5181 Transcript_3432/m.5181 type:complete len:276 (+) Transcript_3432:55-882(+)
MSHSSHADDLKCCDRPDLCSLDHQESHVALQALMTHALHVVTDESDRWNPDGFTKKTISKRTEAEKKWHFTNDGVFVWYGKFDNGGYKGDTPVIKARGRVDAPPRAVLELLFDSSRVKEYNNFSLGREDKHVIKEGIDTDDGKLHGEVKIVRSITSVPMIRKQMELISVLYGRALDEEKDEMKGYIIVNRSVWENENRAPSTSADGSSGGDTNFIRSEMLLGVNLIRELHGEDEGKSELTTITHFFTPGTPTFGARQFGMKASGGFIRDIQSNFS